MSLDAIEGIDAIEGMDCVGWPFGQSPEWILAQRFMLAFDRQPTHFVRRLVAGSGRVVVVLQQQTGRFFATIEPSALVSATS